MRKGLYPEVARKILTESLRMKKAETLTVETWNNGLPFAREVVKQARRIGCIPIVLLEDEVAYLDGVRHTPRGMLGVMGKHEYALLSGSDAYVFIPGPILATYTRKITRQEFIDSTKYNSSWYEAAKKANLRGVRMTFGYLGNDIGNLLGKKPQALVEHQLRASLVDFRALSRRAKSIAPYLEDGKEATLATAGMKLNFTLKGELEIQDGITDQEDVSAGNNVAYMPPGQVVKEVDKASVSGGVHLSPSLTRFGILKDATVEFEDGRVARWGSRASPEVLRKLGEVIPEKNRSLSEVMIGLNPAMKFWNGQDRFPAGSVSLGIGFTGIVRNGTLTAGGKALVKAGRLL